MLMKHSLCSMHWLGSLEYLHENMPSTIKRDFYIKEISSQEGDEAQQK